MKLSELIKYNFDPNVGAGRSSLDIPFNGIHLAGDSYNTSRCSLVYDGYRRPLRDVLPAELFHA